MVSFLFTKLVRFAHESGFTWLTSKTIFALAIFAPKGAIFAALPLPTRNALILVRAFAFEFIEDDLADTHVVWRYLYILILLDILQCLLQREDYRWW